MPELSSLWPPVAQTLWALSQVATVAGVSAAAWLFIWRREMMPRATITHEAFWQPLPHGQHLLHVLVRVKNIGNSRLYLTHAEFRLQQVLPLDWIGAKGPLPSVPGHCEVSWPLIDGWEKHWDECRVEAGEMEEVCCDWVVPAHVEVVELYTFVQNRRYQRPMGWSATTIHRVEALQDEQAAEAHRTVTTETAADGIEPGQAVSPQASAQASEERLGGPMAKRIDLMGQAEPKPLRRRRRFSSQRRRRQSPRPWMWASRGPQSRCHRPRQSLHPRRRRPLSNRDRLPWGKVELRTNGRKLSRGVRPRPRDPAR